MKARADRRTILLAAGDLLVAVVSFVVVVWFRRVLPLPGTLGRLPATNVPLEPWPWLVLVAAAAALAHWLAGTEDEPEASIRERGGLLVASGLTSVFLVGIYFAAGRAVPRTVLVLNALVGWVAAEGWRRLAGRLVPEISRPVLVLGGGEDASRAAAALASGAITGHRLLQWRPDVSSVLEDGAGILGGASDILFASSRPEDRTALVTLLEQSAHHSFELWIVPGLADVVSSRLVTRSLGDLPVVHVEARATSWPAAALRRAMDLVLGPVLVLVTLPVLALASIAVVLETPGPAWIRQRRVGRNGHEFDMWKVRTMRADAESETGPVLSSQGDDRVTRTGRLLRKTRVDELPQLLLVVAGSMTLIGPRPERPEFVEQYLREVPAYRLRHLLKPGITGLAQVMGAYATHPDVKLRYDLGYLFHWNPGIDLFILLRTVSAVLRGSGV